MSAKKSPAAQPGLLVSISFDWGLSVFYQFGEFAIKAQTVVAAF